VRRAQAELGSPDVRLGTKHGEADFAIGDRVQFTDTDKKAHIHNGNIGTITAIGAHIGQLTAKLDSRREVSWSASEFQGFRHGYAGTIYKGQGKPLGPHLPPSHALLAFGCELYGADPAARLGAGIVARETVRDTGELARQMARGEVKAPSVAWATQEEIVRHPSAQPRHRMRNTKRSSRRRRNPSGPRSTKRPSGKGTR
jgi:hypothetical protein